MTGAEDVTELNQTTGPSSDEPPPPPLPPPKKSWKCAECSTTETPVKRSGPQGPGTLCNACGLRIRKKSRVVAAAGAAAAAAAAGITPQRRGRQRKRTAPKPKHNRKADHQQPILKKHRTHNHQLNKVHTVPSPIITVSPATSHPVSTVPPQRVRTPNPVSSRVATSIVLPMPPSVQPSASTSAPHTTAPSPSPPTPSPSAAPAPSPSPPPTSAPPTSAPPSIVTSAPVAVITPATIPSSTTPIQNVAPASSPRIRSPVPNPPALSMPPQPHITLVNTQSIPTSPPDIPVENIVTSAALKSAAPPGGLSRPITAARPPTSPHAVPMLPVDPPPDAMANLLRQSSQTEESKAEDILNALEMGGVTMDAGSAESMNATEQDSFPGSVFARCDSAGTGSTHVEVFDVLDDMQVPDDMPPGTSMVSVEGPYVENPIMAAPACPNGAPTRCIATPPVPMAPPSTGIVQPPHDMASCMNTLTTLDRMNSRISERMSSIDERIAIYARKHEELTVARNEVSFSITQLMGQKECASKKQRQLCEDITRTTYLLAYLQKQVRYVAST